jgi:Family of unknown function (DUF5880)
MTTSSNHLLHGIDISKMLQSKGPVVKCVLLKAVSVDDDSKTQDPAVNPSETTESDEPDGDAAAVDGERHVLVDAIEEIDIDTTPQKQMVSEVLGGKFTFVGQYEDEGIMLMVRNVDGLDDDQLPPINTHVLQPPFDEHEIRGDILILKVAATDEALDDDDGDEVNEVLVPTNEDFFLDYTKAEYVAFAKRTDVVAPAAVDDAEDDDNEEDAEDDDEDDEDDEDYTADDAEGDDDDDDDDEGLTGIMNLLLRSILRKFTDEHGRGPDTEELMNIRQALASKLGIELAAVPSSEEPSKKRKIDVDNPQVKKVKFGDDLVTERFAQVNAEEDEEEDEEAERKDDDEPAVGKEGD